MDRMDRPERRRDQPRAPKSEDRPGRCVRPRVGVGQAAVDDRDRHQVAAYAGQHLLGHAAPRVAVIGGDEVAHLVRSEEDRRSVVAEHVEDADQDRGPEDRPSRVAFRVARLLRQRRRSFEPDEREETEDHALEGRLDPRITWDEDRKRVAVAGLDHEQRRDEHHDADLDQAEGDADPSRDRDAPIGQVPDDARAEQRERHPEIVLLVAGQLGDE